MDNNGSFNEIMQTGGQMIDVDIKNEMERAFMEYSMSVIVSRALPDVRDGLKPVHRRILYAMYEDGITPDKPYKKCATTVGNVLGRYHPHGDASVYDALVRLAQDFNMRTMLVDGHGNFGSVDGDPPAAYRYTEARMSKSSLEMVTDIEKDTVDFMPNFDNDRKEPVVLPSRFPNLLVNGTMGIAVGMASNIPPHNMREVVDAACLLLENPDATLDELMECVAGPDFPTGGIIMGRAGIRAAYATGRGKLTVRARADIEEGKNGKAQIVVTELPYQVNKARLIESIADMVHDKRLEGISNIQDHSDREGMRITIDVKRDASPDVVLNNLFKFTALQSTFGVIMLAIVDGEPKVLSLADALKCYLKHQLEVVLRRTIFDLRRARERAHILEGLNKALDIIDEIITTIRESKGIQDSKQNLIERFGFDDPQATAIVQMRLGQLSGLEREKIMSEYEEIKIKIADFEDIIANEEHRKRIVAEEMQAVAAKHGDKRRTEIVNISGEMDIEDLIPEEDCVITLTNFGYVKRQKMDNYQTQHRGGHGITGMQTREEDVPLQMFIGHTHDWVLFFSNAGRVYRLKGYEIPEGSRTSKGVNIVNLLPLTDGEKITNVIRCNKEYEKEMYLTMITRKGVIKRTPLSAFDNCRKRGLIALTLREDDELVRALLTDGESELILGTHNGMAIRFKESDIRVMGRTAAGVRAMRLLGDDTIIGMSALHDDCRILTVSENGYGRLSPVENYRIQSRGGKGIKNYRREVGDVAAIRVVDGNDDVIIINDAGVIIRIAVAEIRECARPSKGVRVMRIAEGNKIITLARVEHSDEEAQKLEITDEPDDEDEALTAEELAAEEADEAEADEAEAIEAEAIEAEADDVSDEEEGSAEEADESETDGE